MNKKWLIWSIKHNAWWKPCGCGYTEFYEQAGRYTYEEALEIVSGANIPLQYGIRLVEKPQEAMVPETKV